MFLLELWQTLLIHKMKTHFIHLPWSVSSQTTTSLSVCEDTDRGADWRLSNWAKALLSMLTIPRAKARGNKEQVLSTLVCASTLVKSTVVCVLTDHNIFRSIRTQTEVAEVIGFPLPRALARGNKEQFQKGFSPMNTGSLL